MDLDDAINLVQWHKNGWFEREQDYSESLKEAYDIVSKAKGKWTQRLDGVWLVEIKKVKDGLE
jgi:hypothetical protein